MAFGLIGLVMSVLIVANVVGGAVVAGTRRIGVLKSIGFSPAQVVAAYVLQVAVPALIGCVVGVAAGNLLAEPLLSQQPDQIVLHDHSLTQVLLSAKLPSPSRSGRPHEA